MAYADQTVSTRKIVSLSLVVLLHALLGYAFITGLAFNVIKKTMDDLKTFDVEDQPPPPPEAPPPPPEVPKEVMPPPVVTPPPIVQTPTIAAPVIMSTPTPPVIHVEAPPAPPPPPRPVISQAAGPKGNPGSWVTTDDYPASAIRDQVQGTSTLSFDIDAGGRIQNCRVSGSSGSSLLDDTACKLVTRRGRYTPAKDQNGQPTAGGTKTLRFTWRLPS